MKFLVKLRFPSTVKPASCAPYLHALIWVLICLLPVQGIAAGVFATLGPAHVHRATAVVQLDLEDFRRSPMRVTPRVTHMDTAFGHFHRAAEPSRHHHARGDSTAVFIAGDPAKQVADADESTASPALGALTPMLPCVASWLASAPVSVMASSDAWPLLTHDPEPLERPPRRA